MTKLSLLASSFSLLGRQRRDRGDGLAHANRNDDHTAMDNGRARLDFDVLRRGR